VAGTVTAQAGPSTFLTGSTVRALTAGTSTVVATTSVDGNGAYSMSVPAGTYDVQVTPPNGSTYRTSTATAMSVTTDTALDFILFQGSSGPPGTSYISGTIRDLGNAAVAGITVSDGSASATTDAQGQFRLASTDGSHTLRVSNGSGGSTAGFTLQAPITVNGDTTFAFTLPLRRLTVHLTDTTSATVPGGQVQVSAPVSDVQLAAGITATATSQTAGATSGSGGDAVMRVLPTTGSSGNAVGFAAGSPYQGRTFSLPAISADTTVPVTIDLAVQPTAVTYSGTVKDGSNNAVPNVQVAIGSATATTSNAGAFSLQTTAGDHTVTVSRSSASSFSVQFPVTLNADTAQALTLPLKQLTVHVTSGGQPISGAHAAYSAPISDFAIASGVTASGTSQSASNTTNSGGDAQLPILPTAGSAGNGVTFNANAAYQNTTYTLPALSADTTVNVAVQPFDSHLTGTVQDENSQPVSGATVGIGAQADTTDAQGHYSFYTQNGGATLSLHPSSPSVTLQAPITVSGSSSRTLTLPLKRVTFRVIDRNDQPLPNTQVAYSAPVTSFTLSPGLTATATGNESDNGSTDSNGSVRLLALPTTGSSNGNLVTPSAQAGLSPAGFALPSISSDTTILLHFQTGGSFGPVVSCGSADGSWHAANVTIACTAQAAAGLASAGDGSFGLATAVPDGSEDATAATGTRQVCDTLGACVTAGPISANKIDRKGPAITVTTPAASSSFPQGQSVTASYSCSDGGSGVASCTGTVSSGAAIDTASTGQHTFTVQSQDATGNSSSKSITYTVTPNPCAASNGGSYCQAVAGTSGLRNYWRLDATDKDIISNVRYSPGGATHSTVAGATNDGDTAHRTVNGTSGSNAWVNLTPSVDMSGRKPWTIEFWWKEGTSINYTREHVAFGGYSGRGTTGCDGAVPFCMYMTGAPSANRVLARGDTSYVLPEWTAFGGSFITSNGVPWTHMAVTYDGTTVRLYKNGVQQASFTSTVSLPTNPVTQFLTSNDATWDELALYDRALTATELQGHYSAR
jgi:hypothetical protein